MSERDATRPENPRGAYARLSARLSFGSFRTIRGFLFFSDAPEPFAFAPASALRSRSAKASRCIQRRRDPEPCTPDAETGGFRGAFDFPATPRVYARAERSERSRNDNTETAELVVAPELARLPPLPALSRLSGRG
jgi:hypothetical protein